MKLKSYFADTIEEAISLARREMGAEAMLVNSKRSNAEARHLGAYEVVCAADVEAPIAERDKARKLLGSTPAPIDKLSQDVSEIKHQMERLALTLARSSVGRTSARAWLTGWPSGGASPANIRPSRSRTRSGIGALALR